MVYTERKGGTKMKAIVLFSGGQDSTTCLYMVKEHFSYVKALSINYGQKHQLELEAARIIADMAGVQHEIIDLPKGVLKGGDLLKPGHISGVTEGIAPTWVPMRNLLFLTIGVNHCIAENYDTLAIGINQMDYSGYPDCRDDFIESFTQTAELASEQDIGIWAPLIYCDKASIVRIAHATKGCWEALAYTHTCYNGVYPPCGECAACILRAKGFAQAGFKDPLIERY